MFCLEQIGLMEIVYLEWPLLIYFDHLFAYCILDGFSGALNKLFSQSLDHF